ncbi:cation:proton antiporter [Kitasatospora sp. NPDC050467]|uniref:cation:proton antiporter n=1 Tax=Kitasatospora sp. NPDC050467 TaxID=3364053 RepID=UPI0037911E6C
MSTDRLRRASDTPQKNNPARRRRVIGICVALAVVPAVVSLIALHHVQGTGGGAARVAGGAHADPTVHFLVAVVVVLGVARLAGRLAVLAGQPPVVGEICAGIALGPTLLGRLSPDATAWLLPAGVLPMLNALAQLGLALFMFGVGRELSSVRLRGTGSRNLLVTQASLAVPFAAGTVAAVALGTRYLGPAQDPLAFTVFLGCALSITAFPVLARILEELRLTRTPLGRLSLLAAAVGDAGAWLLLAVAVALAQGSATVSPWVTAGGGLATAVLLLWPVRTALRRTAHHRLGRTRAATGAGEAAGGRAATGDGGAAIVLLLCLACGAAALTSAIGLHAVIGAFLAGAAYPTGTPALDAAADRVASFSGTLLLPFFFLGFGLSVDLGALPLDGQTLLAGGALLVAAVLTKLAAGLCARPAGMSWRDAAGLGILLNARGLTELVVLGIGKQAGIIDQRMFAILTVITLLTTTLPVPLLRLLGHGRPQRSAAVPGADAQDDDAQDNDARNADTQDADAPGTDTPGTGARNPDAQDADVPNALAPPAASPGGEARPRPQESGARHGA